MRSTRRTTFALATGVAAGALAFTASAAGPPMTAHTGAKLRVLTPSKSQLVTGNSLSTRVALSNFKIDCALAGTPNRKGIGHYHIELDHLLVNMFCGPRAQISMKNVTPGPHQLKFIPATNSHMDDMQAAKTRPFVYRPSHPLSKARPLHFPGKPSIRIVSPRNGATVRKSFDLVVAVRNFRLSCDLYGKENLAGWGHWHANVDTTTRGMMGMATMLGMSCGRSFHISLAGIEPGTHRFIAILVDNIHAPSVGAQDAVRLTVAK